MLLLMRVVLLVVVCSFISTYYFAQQITGRVVDASGGEPIVGARIDASTGEKALTDFDGQFKLEVASFPVTLITTYVGYTPDTVVVNASGTIRIKLVSADKVLKTVVVSAGRRAQELEEVPISMEIIKPDLVDSKGFTDLEQAVDQSPGVYAMDGQVSIRGGSGYAYGVGSRVMLLWNGMPLLTGDVGDIKFNAIPMENASQIEVMKGASSVLYGSGALNGVVALTERDPNPDGEVKVKLQGGVYDNPKRSSLRWWSSNPMLGMAEVSYSKMHNQIGYTVAVNGFSNQGYRQGETETRGRINGTLLYRPKKISGLRAGLGYNVQFQKAGLYIIWENDSLAYQPSGGADPFDTASNSTLIVNRGIRINVDPYVKYVDKKGNTHNLRTRVYWIDNKALTNADQSNGSTTYFADYQFQNKNKYNGVLTTGISNSYVQVRANLFGQNTSVNPAVYLQYEQNLWKKLTLVGGLRAEYFEQNGKRGDSDYSIGSTVLPIYPVLRAAANYNLFKATFLRASYGQGVRYPSVAERYTFTNVGALNIFPNPELKRETGWASEIGVRQVFRIGKNWKGMLDLAGFINQYDNMIEFAFGVFNPKTYESLDVIPPYVDPVDEQTFFALLQEGYTPAQLIGFQAQNAEKARITGFEASFNSEGKIGEVELRSLLGYTYMNPISLNNDERYRSTFSDSTTNLLKYRFRHLVKGDIEAIYKGFSFGVSARYSSFMQNIDWVFENEVAGLYILPGLKEYRERNNKGFTVWDMRVGYKFAKHYSVAFMVNNVFNTEYMTRPGDIQAPRHYMLQFMFKL
jgi:outer membrane receptor protein involved in Fe transport